MARLRQLEQALGTIFKAPAARKPDTQRRQRERAKALAAEHGIEIEKFSEGGMNVWPPRALDDSRDPFAGDHFADDWADALSMVEQYVALLQQRPTTDQGPSGGGEVAAALIRKRLAPDVRRAWCIPAKTSITPSLTPRRAASIASCSTTPRSHNDGIEFSRARAMLN